MEIVQWPEKCKHISTMMGLCILKTRLNLNLDQIKYNMVKSEHTKHQVTD